MEPLAIYGAIVATISIGWQIATRLLEKKTRLRVEVYPIPPQEPSWLEVICINHSEHPVRMIGLWIAHEDGTGDEFYIGSDTAVFQVEGLSTVIQPRDSTGGLLQVDEFMDLELDMRKPIVAIVRTADDKVFRSKPFLPADSRGER
jgi:hypothetical protein